MTRRPYSPRYRPPAPLLPLRIASPGTEMAVLVPALVDSGADLSVIPSALARHLGLPAVGRLPVRIPGEPARRRTLYRADVQVHEHRETVELLALGDEALIGRDLLRSLVVILDGPVGEIDVRTASPE